MEVNDIKNNYNEFGTSAADNISAMLAYWDNNLVCRFANTAYIDWFGRSREELVNQITMMDLLGPELFAKNYPYVQAALHGKQQSFDREITTPDGQVRSAVINYFPDFDRNGNVRGFFTHAADVTIIKSIEQELKRSNKIITEQNNRLLNFANIVSHNLNTYAFNLESVLDLLDQAETNEDKQEMISHLRAISTNFSETVSHLKQIAEAQNKGAIKYEWISLADYAEKAIAMLGTQIRESNAIIVNHIPTGLKLWANPAYVDSIILNFLTNALKYRHPERMPFIRLGVEAGCDELALRISDNGLGINLNRYGKDLFGMNKTFHGNADAKGIGLFITKYQAEAMGGRVEVESTVGEGSVFTVCFLIRSVQLPQREASKKQEIQP